MKNEIVQLKSYHSPEVESMLEKTNLELQQMAEKKAKHCALKNLPAPSDDTLSNYTNDFKALCEKIEADCSKVLQSETHLADGAVLLKEHNEKRDELLEEIAKTENQIHNESYVLGDNDPKKITKLKHQAIIILCSLFLSEVLLNAKAMQINGDNLLIASLMSIGVSLAVVLLAHFSTHLFKSAKTIGRKRMIAFATFMCVATLFGVLALMRTAYLEANGISVNPWFLFMINIVIFIVSCLVSYFMIPSKEELQFNEKMQKVAEKIDQLSAYKEKCKQSIAALKDELNNKLQLRLKVIKYSDYIRHTICKIYALAVETFKSVNILHRNIASDSFTQSVPNLNFSNDWRSDNSLTLENT